VSYKITEMANTGNSYNKEAIDKLKSLVDEIMICLFCTNPKTDDGSTFRPMSAIKVCDKGNIWFFSEKNSDQNKAIVADNDVQLFFSHPGKDSFMVVNGKAEIILDRTLIKELWTPTAKVWFKEGIEDPNISIIKVTPKNAYYWDIDGNRMINLLKMVGSVATGTNLVSGTQGELKI